MITAAQLTTICPSCKGRAAKFVEPINAAMHAYEIDRTGARQAAFLAQILHESGGLHYVRELATGNDYDGREDLGNTRPEAIDVAAAHGSTPGHFFKGRGLIQITGYDNYKSCGAALGLDLLNDPGLLELPCNAADSAAWFWHTKGLNLLADRGDFLRITRRINGGLTGQEDRKRYFEAAKMVLGVTPRGGD